MIRQGLRILSLAFLLFFNLQAQGAAGSADGDISVVFDGEKINMEEPAPLQNGAVLLPADILVEKLGLKANFLEGENTLILRNGRATILFSANSSTAYVNGEPVRLNSRPRMSNSGLVLPLRLTCGTAGAIVSWDQETRTVFVNLNEKGSSQVIEAIASKPVGIENLKGVNTTGSRLELPLAAFM